VACITLPSLTKRSTPVSIQGEANPKIRLILEGELEVLRDGTLTYVLEKGNFASEAGLHSGLLLGGSVEACGTLVVGPPFDPAGRHNARRAVKNRVRCLAWDRDALTALLRRDRALRAALQAALSWDVVRKLKMQRDLITAGRVRDAAAWTRKREEQGASRYASIVQNLLRGRAGTAAGGARAAEEAALLATYRVIHRIGDGEHAGALARCGWTAEEFRAGRAAAGVEDEAEEEAFVGARWRGVVRRCTTTVQSLLE
jgi:CRP-like cAMP-binding protein